MKTTNRVQNTEEMTVELFQGKPILAHDDGLVEMHLHELPVEIRDAVTQIPGGTRVRLTHILEW